MKKLFPILFFLYPITLLSQELQATDSEALLTVSVNDTKDNPSKGDVITFIGNSSGKSFSGVTGKNGKFNILIPEGDIYTVAYRMFGEDKKYTDLEIPSKEGLINFELNIIYELPKVYTLDNVYFDTGKSTLKPASFKALNNLAELMQNKTALEIEISGHTDNVGNAESNQKLSQDRAKSVRNYLLKKEITVERVVAKGYGDSRPVASNETPTGRQKNRRTEVKILKE